MTMRTDTQPVPGMAWTWAQFGGLAGIFGVVMFIIGFALSGDMPTIDDSASEIRMWFEDNGQQFLVGDFVIAIGVIFGLVPFFTTLRNVMMTAEGPASLWPQIGYVSAILWLIVGAAASMFGGGLAIGGADIKDDGAVLALTDAGYYAFGGISLVIGLFFLATATGIMRTAVFPTWLGWLCLALAVVSVIAGAAPIEADPEGILSLLGFISTIGLGVVILILGVSLFLRKPAVM